MADISKIKLGDETYGIKDARIVSGTLERNGVVAFTGSMVVFHVSQGNQTCVTIICANDDAGFIPNDPSWVGADCFGDSNYRLTNEYNATIYYTAIITD